MSKPHKHAELIKAWADGAEIQFKGPSINDWVDKATPSWQDYNEYRIKPERKPDVILNCKLSIDGIRSKIQYTPCGLIYDLKEMTCSNPSTWRSLSDNLQLIFDGETGQLKSAEVIK